MSLRKIFDVLVPRFITEEVALADAGDRYEIVCSVADLLPDEIPDAIATIRCFNFFGLGLFPKLISDARPFKAEQRA